MVKAAKPKPIPALKQKKAKNNKNVIEKVEKKSKGSKMKPEKPNKKSLIKSVKAIKTNGATLEKTVIKPKEKKIVKAVVSKPKPLAPPKEKTGKKASKEIPANRVSKEAPAKKVYEPIAVDEYAFDKIVNLEKIIETTAALKKLVEEQVAKQKTSIFGDYNYCLNVACFKIASCPKRMVRVPLTHSLVNMETDDVVFVVPDLKRGAKVEYDSTIEHYTDLLREAGIEGLKIMPFNQLKNEYKTYEAKHKLASTFDYYLCDGRVLGQVTGFCGTIFQKPRTTFHAVRMDRPKGIKQEIEKALRRSAYRQIAKGDLISITVGTDKFSTKQVAENILRVITDLKKTYPGGIANMREIDLKINIKGTSSLPIYVCTSEGPSEAPYVIGPREQNMLNLKKQANEVLSKFSLTKDAELKRLSKEQVERKRKLKETRAELLSEKPTKETVEKDDDEEISNNDNNDEEISGNDDDDEISDNDDDEEISDNDDDDEEISDNDDDEEISDNDDDEETAENGNEEISDNDDDEETAENEIEEISEDDDEDIEVVPVKKRKTNKEEKKQKIKNVAKVTKVMKAKKKQK